MSTKSLGMGFAVAIATLSLAGSAQAQSPQYKDLLFQALTASAQGDCPDTIMSVMLADQCQQQMPHLANALQQAGKIIDAKYLGIQQTAAGPAEVYKVEFENKKMTWMINTGPDGKIVVLYSPGPM